MKNVFQSTQEPGPVIDEVPYGAGQEVSPPPSTTILVPLAHPQTITSTNNYGEPCVAVAFATSRPGEPLGDFKARLSDRDDYTRAHGVELVLDREAAAELVRLLIPVVGRTEIGLLIDSA